VFAERSEAARGGKPVELLFAYLSDFSDAHPNWQAEYAVLNKFIPMCFLKKRGLALRKGEVSAAMHRQPERLSRQAPQGRRAERPCAPAAESP